MAVMTVSLLAVSAFGQVQQSGAVSSYAFRLSTSMISGLIGVPAPSADDRIQIWVHTTNESTEGFRVTIQYESNGEMRQSKAFVERLRRIGAQDFYSGHSFAVPRDARLISYTVSELVLSATENFDIK